jgi:N utilization substance protein A
MADAEADIVPRVEAVLAKKAEGRPVTPEEYQTISQFVDRIERGLINRRTAEKRAEDERREIARAAVPVMAFEIPVEDLQFSERVYHLLTEFGYQTVGDLMFQMNLDSDAVLALDGIGPKHMQEIQDKLNSLTFPEPESVVPVEEQPEEVEPVSVEQVLPTEAVMVEPQVLPELLAESSEQLVVPVEEVVGVEDVVEGVPTAVEETMTPPVEENALTDEAALLDEIFSLNPEEFLTPVDEDEDEDDDEDGKDKKKGKKKKKRFVEMVFDPDSGVTIVKRKRKRGDGLGDEWEF